MKKLLFPMLLGVAAFSSPAICAAQTSASSISEKTGELVSELLAVNAYELMLTRMATEKATSNELRQTAEMMSGDHQRMDAELTRYANQFKLSLNPDKREKFDSKVQKRNDDPSGEEWDRDIAEELVDVHRETLNMLESMKRTAKDERLITMVGSYVPVMRRHLDHLLPLKEQLKDGNTTPAATAAKEHTDAAGAIPAGNEKDAKFLSDLRLMNDYELQLMELIFKKGNHRALKNAAQQMFEEHQKLDGTLSSYAQSHRYGNDPDESAKATEKANKWRQKKGGMEWDADIIEELIDIHKDGIDMLEDALTDVNDEQLKDLMNEELPILKQHLKMLQPLKETIKKPWKGK